MSDNNNPGTPTEPASALSAAPPTPTATKPGLWARLSMIQKLSAVVSGGVVTVVGGYAGYSKLTTKPAAAHAEPKVVLAKPDEHKPDPVNIEAPPEPAFRSDVNELPPIPKPPMVTTPRMMDNGDVPLIAPPPVIVSDKPKLTTGDIEIKLPDIDPPKELPATLQNKKDKDVPIIRVGGADDTAPPPKKVDMSVPMIDLGLPPIPEPIKVDVTPPKPDAKDPPLIAPPKIETKDPPLIAPPKPDVKDPPLIAPPKPDAKDPPLIAPPKVETKDPPLIAPPAIKIDDPPTITIPKKEEPPTITIPKKEEPPLISPPTITLPKDTTMPPPRMIEIPPPMPMPMDNMPPTITIPPRKETTPTIEPMAPAPMTPKKDNYEEDWHTKKPGDTYAMVSREYYKSTDYATALEAYNKEHSKAGDRIIRVPPLWVLEERFPNLLGKPEKIEKPIVEPKTPGLKFEPVDTPPVIGGSPRPAPPPAVSPAVAPVGATNDEYRVSNPQGESIRDVARKIFGNADAWRRLWEMNPSLDPTQPIPQGTTLRTR